MNILLLSHYAGSLKYGMEFRPFCLAREWVKAGHSVRIVAASFSHLRQIQPPITGAITHEEIEGIHYCWVKTPVYSGNYIMRAVNIFIFLLRLMVYKRIIVKGFKPDVVIGSSTYPLDNLLVHTIARRFKAKHVYEVHDLWPLSLTDLGGMSPHHPFVLLMQWAEHYAYKNADTVISVLPYAESHMIEHGLGRNKFFYIPNGIDISQMGGERAQMPPLHDAVINDLRAKNMFIVGYTGGHAISNALGSFIVSAVHLKHTNAALVLVGSGAEKANLEKLARKLDLSNVHFLPPVPRNAVQSLLERMDVLFLGWQNKPIYQYGVGPNKLIDYMLSGKPVIHAIGAGNDIVAECGCGISVPPENSRGIAEAVTTFMHMEKKARDEMGGRGRTYILRHNLNTDLAKKFIEVCGSGDAAA